MESFYVSLEYSAWWILPIVAVSLALAWLFYSGKNNWSFAFKTGLGALRFLSVFCLLFLLLNPKINSVFSYKDDPVFPIALDNSRSVTLTGTSSKLLNETIGQLVEKLQKKGFRTQLQTFDTIAEKAFPVSYNHDKSDLSALIGSASVAAKKAPDMLLLTDGIVNSGISPSYQRYVQAIHTFGLGDTIAQKDVAIVTVQNNSIAFLGNKFTVNTDLQIAGFRQQPVLVLLRGASGIVDKKTVTAGSDYFITTITFTVPANQKGLQRYNVEVVPLKGEAHTDNNHMSTYVEVVDDREKVLLIASAPHPDLKAIKSALSKLENVQLELFIPGVSVPTSSNYDLVILHNCLQNEFPEIRKYVKETTSLLYICNSETNFQVFNTENGIADVKGVSGSDHVQLSLNSTFSKFKLNESAAADFARLPPVEVPFAEIQPRPGTGVLLYQSVNGVVSAKPLLLFGHVKRKTGVLLTDGLWLWRMYDFQHNENAVSVDELITKCLQYLSSKEDKRKFRIYPHQKEYFEGEVPQIEEELYNDLYEKVYGQTSTLTISSKQSKTQTLEFTPSEEKSGVGLPPQQPGIYSVQAKVTYGGNQYLAATEFIVKEQKLEALHLTADHQLLREISHKSGGLFFSWGQREQLLKWIDTLEAKPIWKKKESSRYLIDEKWYFFLILLLLTAEWSVRRYTGGY